MLAPVQQFIWNKLQLVKLNVKYKDVVNHKN